MSASNQKKNQDDLSKLTQKERREREEARVAKRNRVVYCVLGVVAVAVVAALLIWNSGFWKKSATAATIGDQTYTVGEVQYYYIGSKNQMQNQYSQLAAYGVTSPLDSTKADADQIFEAETGKTYADYFKEQALSALKKNQAILDAAKAEGYTLSAAGQKSLDDQWKSIDLQCAQYGLTRGTFVKQVYGKNMSLKSFTQCLENDVLVSDYSTTHQEAYAYDDADLESYYEENKDALDSYDYRTFLVDGTAAAPVDENGDPVTDADGNTVAATDEEKQAAMDAAKAKAEQAMGEIKAAGSPEAGFITAAPKYVKDSEKEAYADADHSLTTNDYGAARADSAVATWLKDAARTKGEVGVVEGSSGYYVVLLQDRSRNETYSVNVRHILIKAEAPVDDPATADVDESQNESSQATMDAAKTKAQALLDEFNKGDKTAESFGALAQANSDDGGSKDNGGEYKNVCEGQMVASFNDWIFDPARKEGDTGLVENTNANQQGWHVMYFEGKDESMPYWKVTATAAKQQADQTAWVTDIQKDLEATAADGMKYVGDGKKSEGVPEASPAVEESVAPAEESPAPADESPAASDAPEESPAESAAN